MSITQYNSSVRQMSQSKFNSMKNANGKIPDLANQIVMTNSEDTNISCLRTEVVYDMTSSDASKNWGYTSGIYSDTTVSNKDFSKFSALKVYICAKNSLTVARDSWGRNNILEIDLDNLINIEYGSSNLFRYAGNNNYFGGAFVAISSDKKSLNFLFYDGETLYTSSNGAFIYKIEGILKTPSMIYTGDELTAGNGISIENGVISGIKSEIVWSGNFAYLATEQTMSLDLSKYKYVEFMTTTGNILPMNLQDTRPNGDLYVYLNASSYYNGSWHDGVKCEGAYYYGTKQIKWSGNYCGLAQVRGYWW